MTTASTDCVGTSVRSAALPDMYGGLPGDAYDRSLVEYSGLGRLQQSCDTCVRIQQLIQAPRVERSASIELRVGPLEREIVTVEDTPDLLARHVPTRQERVPVKGLALHQREKGQNAVGSWP